MLTRHGAHGLMRKIWETGGLTPDMEEDIKRLKDDFDEREGILRKYGEVYDGEDKDDYDYVERASEAGTDASEWETKYNSLSADYDSLKQRYLDRFFGTGDVKEEFDDAVDDQKEDTIRDGEPQTFEELLGTADDDFWSEVDRTEKEDK